LLLLAYWGLQRLDCFSKAIHEKHCSSVWLALWFFSFFSRFLFSRLRYGSWGGELLGWFARQEHCTPPLELLLVQAGGIGGKPA
jgi:hypothetical protein